MLEVEVVKVDVSSKKTQQKTDYVAEEKPLHILIDRNHYATILCSPKNLKELAIGHALSAGIIKSIEEIEKITIKDKSVCHVKLKPNIDLEKRLRLSKNFSRIILSACGSPSPYQPSLKLPKIKSNLKVKAEGVLECVNHLNFIAETFRKTGGVHAAAIYRSDGTLVAFAEDVGRHNAVDKVIGMCALNKTDLGKCFLALSGRLTGDIVAKAARMGLPIVASLAAAIDSGIAIAKDIDLTLIGFVRGKRMNIYNFPERVLLN
ncbi:MAG: formate dehydrogenase accessory sulfurtransferase FdhD [Candidatus Bathyarchaeota archaeon]|nr:formate dehydrogenase accessory sulfurtransferase FdhD [Candidatus Bathyarchaeota archaeon]MDH5787491.1 formate dehydrogenase accessory sulfurtransferase FdhD [Candidatus Bathyarchaeota archaeon]